MFRAKEVGTHLIESIVQVEKQHDISQMTVKVLLVQVGETTQGHCSWCLIHPVSS